MDTSNNSNAPDRPVGSAPGGQFVYLVAQDQPRGRAEDEMDLFRLWHILWRSKWLIAGTTAAFAIAAALFASFAVTPMYTAAVVLSPVKEEPLVGLTGQLGGLASLAGLAGIGQGDSDAVAVLRSRDFIRGFIEEQSLLPEIFHRLRDESTGQWTVEKPPDAVQGAGFFVAEIRTIDEDSTGLVTLSIEWRDAELAAAWANMLAMRLNDHMRQRAFTEAEANIKYLRHEFENTSIVTLQQSISDLLENEMQKLMLARGNTEYAFRIIDRAEAPRVPSSPRTILIVALATVFGAMLACFLVLVRDMIRTHTRAEQAASQV